MYSSQWTSEYAVLRDLSQVQGRVPVAIEGVGAGDKPPSLNITEETEEEFFKHCSGDVDVGAVPDLKRIKEMLDMVKNTDGSSDEEDCTNKVIVVSKLNPSSSLFVPKTCNTSTPLEQSPGRQENKETIEKPKKRQRNVALQSILQAIADTEQNSVNTEPITNGLIAKNDNKTIVTDEVKKKITGWFETQTNSPFPKKTPTVILEPTNMMFKKKNSTEKGEKVKKIENNKSFSREEYKPSDLAVEYYEKYLERSRFKESVKQDIWSKAERKMKEIDEKRKRELAEPSASSSSLNLDSLNEDDITADVQSYDSAAELAKCKIDKCSDKISLSQYRHLLTEDCIVCKVFVKNNLLSFTVTPN